MATPETLTVVPAGIWRADPIHSSVGFEVSYLAGTFRGQFREIDAELAVADDGRARLRGVAHVVSVDVKDDSLAAHLQSPDFFDAERHPELRFAADDVSLDGEILQAEGEITIKGVTKPVVVTGAAAAPLTDPYGNERIGLALRGTVDRTEFGVSWNAPLPSGKQALSNDVTIVAELYFVRSS
ncbi:MAG: YceI family protein [Candidatus Limnocylindria bacterium]